MFNKDFHNIKPRTVKCISCKTTKVTNEPNPKCQKCGWNMATVLTPNFQPFGGKK